MTSPARAVATWIVTALVAAGLFGAALTAGRSRGTSPLDRIAPNAAGTTWLYREATNGAPTGTATVRVVGPATLLSPSGLTAGEMLAVHIDNYLGLGSARDDVRYQAKQGNRLVLLGVRSQGFFGRFTPPQTDLELPLTAGRTFRWQGTLDVPKETIVVTSRVVALETVTVAGTRLADCPHLREDTVESQAGTADVVSSTDRWLCPGVGVVRTHQEVPSRGRQSDEELLSVHGPGINLGPVPSPFLAATPAAIAAPSATAIDTARLAWSDSRPSQVVFPPAGGEGLIVTEEEGGRVSAVDVNTGEVRWSVDIGGVPATGPAVTGHTVVIPDTTKHLLGLDDVTGATRWAAGFSDVVSSGPMAVGDDVVVGTEDGHVHSLAVADGRTRWEITLPAPAFGFAVAGSTLFIANTRGTVSAISTSSGAPIWSAHLQGSSTSGPVVGAGVVVAADDQNELTAFDAATGRIRWTDYLRHAVSLPMVLAEATVVTSQGTKVQAFDATTGRPRWTAAAPESVSAPVVVGGDVVVQTRDQLLRLGRNAGERRATVALAVPSPGVRPRMSLTPQLLGGQLVTTSIFDVGIRWPRTTILAFPAVPTTGPAGVVFTGDFRYTPTAPARAPVGRGDDLVIAGIDGLVYDVPKGGSPRLLQAVKASSMFAVVSGDLVLTRAGDSLVASGPEGQRWTLPIGPGSLGDVPAVSSRSVLVPVSGEGLVAVDPATGRPQWVRPAAGQGATTPLVLPGDDVIYAVGGLARLDGETGRPRWQIAGFDAFGPLAQDGGTVFAAGLLNNRQVLLAVDAATGSIRWQVPFPVKLLVGPVAAHTTVVALGSDGVVQALDESTGRIRWSVSLLSPAGSPVILGDKVAIGDDGRSEDSIQVDHRVTVLDLTTGRLLGVFAPGSNALGFDAFGGSGDRLFVPTNSADGPLVFSLRLAGP